MTNPLPITIVPGMAVVPFDSQPKEVIGITERYCVYRDPTLNILGIEPWKDVAVANVCPARPLLPDSTDEIDCQNGQAVLLRELLALQQFGLTEKQEAVLEELKNAILTEQWLLVRD
jgi:hypothetical protein